MKKLIANLINAFEVSCSGELNVIGADFGEQIEPVEVGETGKWDGNTIEFKLKVKLTSRKA